MQINKIILLLFLTLLSFSAQAYDIPNECNEKANTDCVTCKLKSPSIEVPNLTSILNKPFGELAYIEDRVKALDAQNSYLKKYFVSLYRTLRDGNDEPTVVQSRKEIALIREDFDRLTALSKETARLQLQSNYCLFNCSASWKLELKDQVEAAQKLKMALFIKRPILANEIFEKKMMKMDDAFLSLDTSYSQEDFEKTLKDAIYNNIQKIDERDKEFTAFEYDGDKPVVLEGNEAYGQKYLDNIASNFPRLSSDILREALYSGDFSEQPNKIYACHLAKNFSSYTTRKKYTDGAIDAGIFLAPMLLGPLGVEASMAARLAGWGLKASEMKTAARLGSLAFQAAIGTKELHDLNQLSRDCRQKEVLFLSKSSESLLNEFKLCQKDLGEKVFRAELSLGFAGFANFSPVTLQILSKGLKLARPAEKAALEGMTLTKSGDIANKLRSSGISSGKNQLGMEFTTTNDGVFSVLNLENLPRITNPNLKELPDKYWRYVGNIYNERLKLTPKEIENFIKSSSELSPRTKLIINTEKSILNGEVKINGGIGLVVSENSNELLSLEKATGHRIPRKPDEKIAEIVRLAVDKDGNPEKMSGLLISQMLNLINSDKKITRIFILTSKAHSRIYQKIGVPKDCIKKFNDRDVIMEFGQDVVERVIQSQNMKKVIYWIQKNDLKISLQAA